MEKKGIIPALLSFIITCPAYSVESVSIETVIQKRLVAVYVSGTGGYTGEIVSMRVQNLTPMTLAVCVEAGRQFDSKDSTEQDLLVVRAETFAVAPNEQKLLTLYAMCCQAYRSSPRIGSEFSVGNMAGEPLVKLARFIEQNAWYEQDMAQHAVWAVSDGCDIEGIWGEDAAAATKLREFVSKLTGRPVAAYQVKYEKPEDGAVFSGKVAEVLAVFEYELYTDGLAGLYLYDSKGRMVDVFFSDFPHRKGQYRWNISFITSSFPKGKYYARLWMNGQKLKEMQFRV